jgi:prepilin-type processing-associated H-X9-DG protein
MAVLLAVALLVFPPKRPPVDTKPLENARKNTDCVDKLRQVGQAIMHYTQDYDGVFPITDAKTFEPHADPGKDAYGYFGALKPYLKQSETLHCPAMKKGGVSYVANGSRTMKYDGFEGVWGLHAWWGKNLWYSYPAKRSQVASPANVILAFDCVSPQLCSMNTVLGDVNSGWYGGFFGQFDKDRNPIAPLHDHGMNFLFCDGHVQWFDMMGHPGWSTPTGYIHKPKPREVNDCLAGGRRPSVDIYMADWPQNKISFRRDYKPGVNDVYPP